MKTLASNELTIIFIFPFFQIFKVYQVFTMERERGDEGEPTDMESGEVVVVAQAKDVNDNLGHGIASGFGGGGEQRRHLPPSKNMKSQCIICKKYIVKQNMKDHAKVVHKTSAAKVLGHKSVLEMFALPDMEVIATYLLNTHYYCMQYLNIFLTTSP